MNISMWVGTAAEFAIYIAVIFFLVGGSVWLDLFLSAAVAFAIYLNGRVIENRRLFDISAAHLVDISRVVHGLEVTVNLLQE